MAPLVTLAVNNTSPRKSNPPKIGTRHGDPDWQANVAFLRFAVRAAHRHASKRQRPFSCDQHDDVAARKAYADRVALDLINCSGEIDEAGLLIVHLAVRMAWVLNNNAAARRTRTG
jgi:hypothetical protein